MPNPVTRGLRPAILALSLALCGCAGSGSLFFFDQNSQGAPRVADVETAREPIDPGCSRTASRRADDAVMAGYATEGSAELRHIYDTTYRNCESWHRHRSE